MDTSERGKRINKVLDDLNLARDKIGERIVIHKIEIREVQKEIGREIIKRVKTGRKIRYSGSRREKLAIETSILRNKIEGKLEEIRRLDNHFGEVWGSLEEIGRERQRSGKKIESD